MDHVAGTRLWALKTLTLTQELPAKGKKTSVRALRAFPVPATAQHPSLPGLEEGGRHHGKFRHQSGEPQQESVDFDPGAQKRLQRKVAVESWVWGSQIWNQFPFLPLTATYSPGVLGHMTQFLPVPENSDKNSTSPHHQRILVLQN